MNQTGNNKTVPSKLPFALMTALAIAVLLFIALASLQSFVFAEDGTGDGLETAAVTETPEDSASAESVLQSDLMVKLTEGYTPYVIITVITIVITFIRMKINEHRKD